MNREEKCRSMLLDRELGNYAESENYPFHMPGHKRVPADFPDPYRIDITEIDGFDNLHHAEGILKEAQQRAADLYQAKQAWYLINGSTCGLLAAISAAVPKGAKVLVARNCHKAVYHAIYLRELIPVYLYPEITSFGLQGQIRTETVERALCACPDAAAVILTSPTYDGIVSNIAEIAEIVHKKEIPLIVDQAHGAHFGLSEYMPENAGKLGADLVVVSVHKTLPAFTQTALLFSYSDRVPAKNLDRFLDIYETSSPSYILMAGIERCISLTAGEGERRLADLRRKLDWFYRDTGELQNLYILKKTDFTEDEAYQVDDSKILIWTGHAGISGAELAEMLRREYNIEPEMASGNYVLALTSFMDTQEGFLRLADALKKIDSRLKENAGISGLFPSDLYTEKRRMMEIHDAADAPQMTVSLEEAEGKICADYLYLYPPGIPIIVPGEQIDKNLKGQIEKARAAGLEICGLNRMNRTEEETEEIYGIPILPDGKEFQRERYNL